MRRLLARFGADEGGLALIEFAVSLPVMLLLYLGGWQLSDAIACNRKVTITARTLADLTSQYSSLPSASVQSILNASTQVLAPYSSTNAIVRVSEVYTDTSGATKVVWSQANPSASALAIGSSFALPASITTNGTYLIYGEVYYKYTPVALYGLVGPLTLHDQIYMSPRVSTSVTWTL